MGRPLFVDTGVFVAHALADDQHHTAASRIIESGAGQYRLVTWFGVLLETVTVLRRLSDASVASQWGAEFDTAPVEILEVNTQDWDRAMEILGTFADHRLSAVDAMSFAIIRRSRIKAAASFDKHFDIVLRGDVEIIH